MGSTREASRFSHVAIQLTGPDDAPVMIEAEMPTIRKGVHQGGHRVPWAWRYEQPRRDRALAWLETQVGKGYGVDDLISNAARILGWHLGVFREGEVDCSHLTFVWMSLAGEEWPPAQAAWIATPQLVTPAALYTYTQDILAGRGGTR